MREPKIDQLDDAGLVEEDVLELEVAVGDASEVAIPDALEHLQKEATRDRLGHRVGASVDDLVEELAAAGCAHK